MISAEQARQNANQYAASEAARKAEKANNYINNVVEPAILQASMIGKTELTVSMTDSLDIISEVIGIITGAGYKITRGRADCEFHVSW